MQLHIKKFNELTREEIYNIFRLRSEVFVVEQNCVYNDIDGKDENATHIFFEKNEKIIAYLRTYSRSEELASFGRVCVDKEHRKEGLGRKIVEEGIKYIRKNALNTQKIIFIEAQEYLKKFYESFGFIKKSETYLEDGIPHIDMELIK